jgi:hypothetical protein
MQVGDGRPQLECNPRGGKRVGVGGVALTDCNAVTLTDRAQSPLASPEAIELLVEHKRIDNEHPVWPADSVDQRWEFVPPGLAIQDGQSKRALNATTGTPCCNCSASVAVISSTASPEIRPSARAC